MTVKIVRRNVKITDTQLAFYQRNKSIKRAQVPNLRFGKIAFTTDADVDGAHISGLLMNLFDHFWPELYTLGVIHVFRTPLVKVTTKKEVLEFFTEREFNAWAAKDGAKMKGWAFKYYKGLGTSSAIEFRHYMERLEEYLFRIEMSDAVDKDSIDLAFNSQRADDRKVWLESPAENFEEFVVNAAV